MCITTQQAAAAENITAVIGVGQPLAPAIRLLAKLYKILSVQKIQALFDAEILDDSGKCSTYTAFYF